MEVREDVMLFDQTCLGGYVPGDWVVNRYQGTC